MTKDELERILIVDDNPILRGTLAQWLRAAGHDVVTADTGECAFFILRDWGHPIGWLYTRAALPGLIDGWILADAYHDTHPDRAAVISAPEARRSVQGDIVLKQPTPTTVLETLGHVINTERTLYGCADVINGPRRAA